ncbi:MAG: OsmC family protein [Candidatus Cloacimonetes bacterium]|jgi:putative redox protein|nr:OsmC family protein [Candidatus Cloacimonadota bacterium]
MAGVVVTKWTGDLSFDSLVAGHHVMMDVDKEHGGNDTGPRPKSLLLTALAGCSGMDVVSILQKMQVKDYSFEMEAEGEPTKDHPVVYHTITIAYKFTGSNLPEDKIVKAVTLSTEKYCGVYAMLKEAAKVVVKVLINGTEVNL